MESLIIAGTETSPSIILDSLNNVFLIKGRSIPSDGIIFYEPVLEWLKIYSYKPNQHTHFTFNLELFNITSSKMFLFILYKLNDIKNAGYQVTVNWCYNNDEMLEAGEDFAYMVEIPFTFVNQPLFFH